MRLLQLNGNFASLNFVIQPESVKNTIYIYVQKTCLDPGCVKVQILPTDMAKEFSMFSSCASHTWIDSVWRRQFVDETVSKTMTDRKVCGLFFLSFQKREKEVKAEAAVFSRLVLLGCCCRANERAADGWNVGNAKDQRAAETQWD